MFSRIMTAVTGTVTSLFSDVSKDAVVDIAPVAIQPRVSIQHVNSNPPFAEKKKKKQKHKYYQNAHSAATVQRDIELKQQAEEKQSQSEPPKKHLSWLEVREAEKKEKIKNALERDRLKSQNAQAKKQKHRENGLKATLVRSDKISNFEVVSEEQIVFAKKISEKISEKISKKITLKAEKAVSAIETFVIPPEHVTVANTDPNGIGSGRHSKIFKGFWKDKPVALKFFAADSPQSDYHRFLEEIDKAKQIETLGIPSAVKFFGAVNVPDDHYHCLVMEYIPKGTLWDWLKPYSNAGEHPPVLQIFKILSSLASNLAMFNQARKIHCDLKLENVMLLDDFQVKLIDFEFSLSLQLEQASIRQNTCFGSAGYAAPEVINFNEYSYASDIFAFGSLIYCLGCLGMPFAHKNFNDGQISSLIARHSIYDYHPVHYLKHWGCPDALVNIIFDCWNSHSADRPSAQALANRFDLLVKQEESKIQSQEFNHSEFKI